MPASLLFLLLFVAINICLQNESPVTVNTANATNFHSVWTIIDSDIVLLLIVWVYQSGMVNYGCNYSRLEIRLDTPTE